MALATRNLSVLSYAQGFTLWHYKADGDRLDDVTAPGFFRDAGDLLAPGDMMMISARDGGQILTVTPGTHHPTLTPLR